MKTFKPLLIPWMLVVSIGLIAQSKKEMPFTTSSAEAAKLLRQAWVLYGDVKIDDGNKLVRQALEIDPDFGMAQAFINSFNAEEQKKNMEKAQGLKLSADEKMFIDGRVAGLNNQPSQLYHDPLLKKFPKDDYLHLLIAFNNPDWNYRIETGEALVKRNPKFAPAYNMLGYAYMQQNNLAKAETNFNKYMALRPDLANVYDSKADYMMRVSKFQEAAILYEKAATLGMTASKLRGERALLRAKYLKPSTDEVAQIKSMTLKSVNGLVKGDVDEYISQYADQAIEIFRNQMFNVGAANMRQRANALLQDRSYTRITENIDSIEGIGPIALAWGKTEYTIKDNSSNEAEEHKGNVIYLFRKQEDGNWRILARHIFADDEPESPDDVALVRQVLSKWNSSANIGHELTESYLDSYSALYSSQAIEIYSSQRSNVGIANLRMRWSAFLGVKYEVNSLGTIGVDVIGRRAVAWGTGIGKWYAKGSTELTTYQFPWAMILTKEKDDEWRILVMHWYSE